MKERLTKLTILSRTQRGRGREREGESQLVNEENDLFCPEEQDETRKERNHHSLNDAVSQSLA